MYYLDTNVFISLGKKIRKIKNSSKCITSSLTIMEILKNLRQENYSNKRSYLKNIWQTEILIDWDTLNQKIDQSFGNFTSDPLQQKLKEVFESIIKFKDYDNFATIQNNQAIKEINDYLNLYNEKLRSMMNNPENNKQIQKSLYNGDIKKSDLDYHEMKNTLYKLAILSFSLYDPTLNYMSYNRLLDTALLIQIEQTLNFILDNKKLKNNDTVDHYHFFYFQNRTYKMVTDDKRVLHLTKKVLGNRRAISLDEFKTTQFLR